ncbi:hypothetical protein V8D89_006817 [Ganoderma adspersum]
MTRCGVSPPPPRVFQNGTKCGVNSACRGPPTRGERHHQGDSLQSVCLSVRRDCAYCCCPMEASADSVCQCHNQGATYAGFGLVQESAFGLWARGWEVRMPFEKNVVPHCLRSGFHPDRGMVCCPAEVGWWSTDHSSPTTSLVLIRCMVGLWGTISAVVPIARPLAANMSTLALNKDVRGWMDMEHGVSSVLPRARRSWFNSKHK